MFKKSLIVCFIISVLQVSFAFADCDDGRIPCSHKCNDRDRPACKDSRGSSNELCITPRFCRDNKAQRNNENCDPGWKTRDKGCSKKQRKKGCKDARGKIYGYCIKN